jgi:hypothetical protein
MESLTIAVQIIGSIASILGIPLAVYLFLRQRESKFRKLRAEILDVLSRQIGEGRMISVFELQSVIETRTREYKTRRTLIRDDSVIEDLVTETVRNPMLATDQKQGIIDNLQQLHTAAMIYERLSDLESTKLNVDLEEFRRERVAALDSGSSIERLPVSQIFAVLAGTLTVLALAIATLADFSKVIENIDPSKVAGIVGVIVSVAAVFSTQLYVRLKSKRKKETAKSRIIIPGDR